MKRMILVCCLCLAATPAYAEGDWIADAKTGCKVWNPQHRPDTVTWSGECNNGKANGKGTLKRYEGEKIILTFEGVIKDGKAEGEGRVIYQLGEYNGEFVGGQMHGNGKFVWKEGTEYNGEFKGNMPNGNGTMLYKSGDKYSGGWSEGKEHGKGTYTFKDGTSYEGLWEHGERIKIF
jgi:hypothetical protein